MTVPSDDLVPQAGAPNAAQEAALQSTSPTIGTVTSVNISARKGTRKTPLESGTARILIGSGVEGDAHAGDWHRQVSFLAEESIEKARGMGLDVKQGDFAENITTEGIDLPAIPVGTQLRVGDAEVEISQIGKVCHTRCAIYHLAGDCIFPREGIFSVVRKEGAVKVGDPIEVLKWGTGSCDATPPEALAEVEAARAAGTL
ncbi:MAG: MOSC domain-containing protein [Coriobacteriales bacterium]|jgi:MOSC domain-containing protein YiiM|nr:MOSC domain-containing protein [Coriobacteriales bacterium]MDR0350492.1 MOSC domain-containing protein [Coriobacteriales bacterium]